MSNEQVGAMTLAEVQSAYTAAHRAWWDAYTEMHKTGRYEPVSGEMNGIKFTSSKCLGYDPELTAKEAELKAEAERIKAEGIRLYAKPEVQGCGYCASVSVFGGPSHRTSPRCQSGRKPHCTCDTCF